MLQTALTMIPQEVFAAHRSGQAFLQANPLTRTVHAGITADQSPEGSEVTNTLQIDLSESPQFVQDRPKRLADETDTVQKVAMGHEINREEELGDAPHLVPGQHNRLGETIHTSQQFWIGRADQDLGASQPEFRKDLGGCEPQQFSFRQQSAFSNVLDSSRNQAFAIPSATGTQNLGQHNLFRHGTETTAVHALVGEKIEVEQHLGTSQPQRQSRKDLEARRQEYTSSQETAFRRMLESSLQQAFATPSPMGTNHLGQHNIFSNGTETTTVQAFVGEKVAVEQDLGASQPKFSMDGEQQQFIIHQQTALGYELASSPHHAFAISAPKEIDNLSMEAEGAYAGAQPNL
jgi:hypothetical protein